jgi:pilus assembly protein CpaB
MSFRTIIVGILAAFCGICATVGVMTMKSGTTLNQPIQMTKVVVAKTDIDMGQKIAANVIDTIDWKSEQLPPGAFTSKEEVIDKYCTAALVAGEVLTKARFDDNPTTLVLGNGMRAYAIDAIAESTNVGGNLVAGNRVDIIWQTNGKIQGEIDPITVRLLQNVKILAVGRVQTESVNTSNLPRSLTLEVRPKMDEDLAFAQSYGTLTLSVRNPGDNEGIEPIQLVRFKDLLANLEAKAKEPTAPTAWEKFSEVIANRVSSLEHQLSKPIEKSPQHSDRETLNRIAKGMRAITIQTPSESTGLAGLLEPGDRVDLQLTVARKMELLPTNALSNQFPSETLIENIEVLAVDSRVFSEDNGEGEKKMGESVTLIVLKSMIEDIAKASQLGSLSLTLRGVADSESSPPRVVMRVDQFVAKHLPAPLEPFTNSILASTPVKIRTLRGPAVQEMPFAISQ